ncbi:MAG: ParA family protein [Thermomicrobiales bacterium]
MILAVASQKGGTGKTTTSISLAAGLAHRGKRTLLIDTDSQANSSKVVLPNYQEFSKDRTLYATIIDRKPLAISPTSIPNLDIVPSHILLSETDISLTTAIDHREARLKAALEAVKGDYDFVVIDCPPALSWLTLNAFTAADKVLVVVSPGYFELDSTVQMGKTIEEVKIHFNPELELAGFVFTMSEPTINTKNSLKLLRQTYGDSVLNTIIPKNVDLRDAHFNQQDIFSYNASSKGSQAYERLIGELFSV